MRVWLRASLCLLLAGCSGTANTQVDANIQANTQVNQNQTTIVNQQINIVQQNQQNIAVAPVSLNAPQEPQRVLAADLGFMSFVYPDTWQVSPLQQETASLKPLAALSLANGGRFGIYQIYNSPTLSAAVMQDISIDDLGTAKPFGATIGGLQSLGSIVTTSATGTRLVVMSQHVDVQGYRLMFMMTCSPGSELATAKDFDTIINSVRWGAFPQKTASASAPLPMADPIPATVPASSPTPMPAVTPSPTPTPTPALFDESGSSPAATPAPGL